MLLRKHNHADWSHFNSMAVDSTPQNLCRISSSPLPLLLTHTFFKQSSASGLATHIIKKTELHPARLAFRVSRPLFSHCVWPMGGTSRRLEGEEHEFLPARSKNGSGAIYLLKDTAPARQPLTHYNLSCSPRAESGSPRFAAMGCFAIPCWFCLTLSSQFYRFSS